ncbi:17463_t:CDS:1 [Cetraspora pellucida]|uniref:17463_t:CDS:1 n=1 Tax=Cetraspora pellucida TaxID=1433469 RepID=A0ACA9NEE3_9GLOM|nr:17463_t:CDS:1 [Cetraspora pellucida]
MAKLRLKINNYQTIIKQKDQQAKSKRIEINRNKAQTINKQKQEISQLKADNQNLATQLQQAQQQVANLQQQINNHDCSCPNICCANGDYSKIKQQLENHKCPSVDNGELESLREEVKEKDQKIIELEQEIKTLKDKPPMVDNSEVERLLGVIEEKEVIIRELQTKEPQIIEVESGEVKELREMLVKQEQKIKRLHVIYLLLLGMSVIFSLAMISKKKNRRKYFNGD